MKDAAKAAGYTGASPQSLCNTARGILTKFTGDPNFHRAWTRKRKIAQLLAGMADNSKSERQQLKTMRILAALL